MTSIWFLVVHKTSWHQWLNGVLISCLFFLLYWLKTLSRPLWLLVLKKTGKKRKSVCFIDKLFNQIWHAWCLKRTFQTEFRGTFCVTWKLPVIREQFYCQQTLNIAWNEPRHDKTNKMSVRPAKTQISLGFRPVWSESSLSARRKLGSLATHWVHSKDSDQTGWMPRLIESSLGAQSLRWFVVLWPKCWNLQV